jgi:hypothetical protein
MKLLISYLLVAAVMAVSFVGFVKAEEQLTKTYCSEVYYNAGYIYMAFKKCGTVEMTQTLDDIMNMCKPVINEVERKNAVNTGFESFDKIRIARGLTEACESALVDEHGMDIARRIK